MPNNKNNVPSTMEVVISFVQKCLQTNPVIVIGTGASVPYGIPGMPGLKNYLLEHIDETLLSSDEFPKWQELWSCLQTMGLEEALHAVTLPIGLTKRIVQETWECIYKADVSVLNTLLQNRQHLALTRLYDFLFTSSNTLVQVVTTNYDRLAEYAANVGNLRSYVGYPDGYVRQFTGELSKKIYQQFQLPRTPIRTVCVWKVHGSLDWFCDVNGIAVAIPMHSCIPANFDPLIVTPGISKFERTHQEPFRTIISQADDAMTSSLGFFCVGYGFNDTHIQPKLVHSCSQSTHPIVVIAKQLTSSAKEVLISGHCRNFLAIEESEQGSRVYNNNFDPSGVELPDKSLWELPTLLNYVLPR